MKILITGATGFIGTHLCHVLAQGNDVLAYSRGINQINAALQHHTNIKIIQGDICDQERLLRAMAGADIVIHLASTTIPSSSNRDPKKDIQTNLIGAINVLEGARENNIKKLVFVSSGGAVYGENYTGHPVDEDFSTNPISSYGIIKLAIEKYIYMYRNLYGLRYAILRVSNPYGPNQYTGQAFGAVSVFLHKILRGEQIDIWGDGSTKRDFIYISDLTQAIQLACSSNHSNLLLNIGAGRSFSLLELVTIIAKRAGVSPKIVFHSARGFDVRNVELDINRAKRILGWQPRVGLEAGIDLLIQEARRD